MAEIISSPVIEADRSGHATIEVSGHGVGGYTWKAEVVEGMGTVVAQPMHADNMAIGAGAILAFSVSDVNKSGCKVKLIYARDWEDKSLIEKTVTIVGH